mmetsp:Transcript_9723/g.29647  ORF Transcript_9723/g.29647 Transcript_9723/m.29647 type:complete len:87 (-) Transcript_9723:210-470(-)
MLGLLDRCPFRLSRARGAFVASSPRGVGGVPSPAVSFGALVSPFGDLVLLHVCCVDLLRHFPMGAMSRMAPDQPLVPEHEGGIAAV